MPEMNRRIVMVIPTSHIGGAEKRMLGFWIYACQHLDLNLKLVVSRKLLHQVKQIKELQRLVDFHDHIVVEEVNNQNVFAYKKAVQAIFKKHITPTDILHFISAYPLFLSLPNKTIFTFTESSLDNVNKKGKIGYYLSFFQADLIDVLDPIVYEHLMQSLFFRKKMSRTPNSFVDAAFFEGVHFSNKLNRVTHLGRFHPGKQIDKFIEALPKIDSFLKSKGILDCEYFILGYGALEESFKQMMAKDEYKGIKCEIFFTNNPQEQLNQSKIILSIQEKNNYPSKALLEGMACGNIPLVTDVGTTRKIADPSFSYFLKLNLRAEEFAEKIYEVLSLDEIEFQKKASAAIKFVKENFTIKRMAEYYCQLYKRIID